MTIPTFIEKAIEGGWKVQILSQTASHYEISALTRRQGDTWGVWLKQPRRKNGKLEDESTEILLSEILLDPEAWKAVGKVDVWFEQYDWSWHMHRMIDALAEGKTIEQYLLTL